jgi:NADPH2:quinone reductase
MKAVRVHAWNEPPRVEEVPEPVAAPGTSLVRMQAATVGHIDRTVWSGQFLRHPPLPYVPGVEGAGVVVASERFAPGQRVWLRGAGLGILRDGTWREVIAAPDDALGVLPEGVPMALGSAFFSPCTSAWVALHDVGQLQAGEEVLVCGASGAVGSIACQLAREAGARVRAVVFDAAQAARLPAGVEAVAAQELKPEAELLLDTVGGTALPVALRGVAPGGRAVLVGYAGGTEIRLSLPELLQRDIALLGIDSVMAPMALRQQAWSRLARDLEPGLLEEITSEVPLSEAVAAAQRLMAGQVRGRIVVKTV